MAKKKTEKGCVAFKKSNGRLQLVVRYQGERYYISPELAYNKTNINAQKQEGALTPEIEKAIANRSFPEWYEKFKAEKDAQSKSSKDASKNTPKTLSELWECYVEHKREVGHNGKPISESTLKRDYGKVSKRLAKLPSNIDYPQKAVEIKEWLLGKAGLSNETVRRMLVQLNAACKWALKSGLIEENLFADLPRPAKVTRSDSDDYRAFSAEERDSIIGAFEENTFCSPSSPVKHSFYVPFVKLSFMTGMRPEELTALTWGDISDSEIRIDKARPDTGIIGNTKTNKARQFPINGQLRQYLDSIRPESARRLDLVSPAPKRGYFNNGNFLTRVWKPVINGLVSQGKVNEYLSVYHMRHTFINKALKAGIEIATVAYWVGNSPETIMKHYASRSRNAVVPEI